jgi:hypothetical protein
MTVRVGLGKWVANVERLSIMVLRREEEGRKEGKGEGREEGGGWKEGEAAKGSTTLKSLLMNVRERQRQKGAETKEI